MKLELTLIALAAASPVLAAGRPSSLQSRRFGVVARGAQPSSSSTCIDDILDIRGGAVHESSTLSDLESRIQSAALQDKLTVVDFTATW